MSKLPSQWRIFLTSLSLNWLKIEFAKCASAILFENGRLNMALYPPLDYAYDINV